MRPNIFSCSRIGCGGHRHDIGDATEPNFTDSESLIAYKTSKPEGIKHRKAHAHVSCIINKNGHGFANKRDFFNSTLFMSVTVDGKQSCEIVSSVVVVIQGFAKHIRIAQSWARYGRSLIMSACQHC